jgi:hypothetical protein
MSPPGVRSRIASLEAQKKSGSHSSGTRSRSPSPAARPSSRARVLRKKQPKGSQYQNETPETATERSGGDTISTDLNESLSSASTTQTAAQNRKSRLQHQQLRPDPVSDVGNVSPSLFSSSGNPNSNPANLVEKRKLMKERWIMQKQRRTAISSSNPDYGEQHEDSLEQHSSVMNATPSYCDARDCAMKASTIVLRIRPEPDCSMRER